MNSNFICFYYTIIQTETMGVTTDEFTVADIHRIFEAWENKDPETPAEYWAKEGVYIDPHYPEAEYRGPEAVQRALESGLEESIAQPRLTIQHVWEDEDSFVVEVRTHHTLVDDTEVDYQQVFVIETRDGKITRWQSYLPFERPGEQ